MLLAVSGVFCLFGSISVAASSCLHTEAHCFAFPNEHDATKRYIPNYDEELREAAEHMLYEAARAAGEGPFSMPPTIRGADTGVRQRALGLLREGKHAEAEKL